MLTEIKKIEIAEGVPTTTISLFRPNELKALCDQTGATGRALISFIHTDGETYEAAVGRNDDGPMVSDDHLVAIPCPPACPGGKRSFTPKCM